MIVAQITSFDFNLETKKHTADEYQRATDFCNYINREGNIHSIFKSVVASTYEEAKEKIDEIAKEGLKIRFGEVLAESFSYTWNYGIVKDGCFWYRLNKVGD